MKKIIIAAFTIAAASTSAFAQDARSTTPAATPATTPVVAPAATPAPVSATAAAATAIPQDNNKTKVDPANLPAEVKTTLAGDAYKGWTATSAWLISTEPAYYSVELKKDEKINVVNIDKSGKVR